MFSESHNSQTEEKKKKQKKTSMAVLVFLDNRKIS